MSCDEISADWAAQRIKGLDLATAIINGAQTLARCGRKRRRGRTRRRYRQDADRELPISAQGPRHDVGGGGAQDQGARRPHRDGPRTCRPRIRRRPASLWRIEVATADGGRETYTARHVVSSAPLRELVERIKPVPISLLHARALRYRDFLTVALMVRKAELFPDNWIYIHDPSVKVGRVQNFRSWSPEMVPEGMSCLGLEYFCFEGDGLWNAARPRSHRAGESGSGADRACCRRRRGRRLRGAPGQGLSGLRRRTIATTSPPSGATSKAATRRCTWSAATACTDTTIRTTR